MRIVDMPIASVRGTRAGGDPWRGNAWFREDRCQGPGNVLFVETSGAVHFAGGPS